MKAETIAIGSELLLGQIANTNAQIISKALQDIGIDVYFHTCVGDNRDRIIEVFSAAIKRSDLIILTGGLGPTIDDLTKETISSYLKIPLEVDQHSLERIKKYFETHKIIMTKNNYKQALMPKNAVSIPNKRGTAPGVLLKYDSKIIVMLPGPPFEMEPMLMDTVIPYLSKLSSEVIHSRVLKFYGLGESKLEEEIEDLLVNQTNPTSAPLAKMGEVTLRITAKADSVKKAQDLIEPLEKEILSRIGEYVYGYDNENIEEIVARFLSNNNLTLATAESCTGGLISHKLTNVPGVSKNFERGIISYSNRSKTELLGVKHNTLKKYGAVSEQTALEMAQGLRKLYQCDIGLSITGIAGPGGGTDKKPVGLVYIGYSDSKSDIVKKHIFRGIRKEIKERAANAALHLVFNILKTYR